MRVDVTGWSRVEARNNHISFRANSIEMYLTAEEITRYDLEKHTVSNGTGFFRLHLDVHADLKYLSVGGTVLPVTLREQVRAEVERQEESKNQVEGSVLLPKEL